MDERTSTSLSTAGLAIPDSCRVLLCVGPGGVGKTTVSAALGLAAAQAGRRTIVVTIDPSRRLAQALGIDTDPSKIRGDIIEVPGTREAGNPLDCLFLDTQSVFDGIVRGYSSDPVAGERMLTNPIYQATAQHLGGALEYAATARVHMLHAAGEYDLIVLDTPPTANAIEFLDAPGRITELLDNPAARFLAGSGRLGTRFFGLAAGVMVKALRSIGGGPFIGELGTFLHDFGAVLGEFKNRAGDVENLLKSAVTGVVLATSAADFSVREAKAFLEVILERQMRVCGVVLNRVDPPMTAPPSVEQLRRALRTQVPAEQLDLSLDQVVRTYAGALSQSKRAISVAQEMRDAHPEFPTCVLPLVDPPPTSLEALREMGRSLWKLDTMTSA